MVAVVFDEASASKIVKKRDTWLLTVHGFVRFHIEASIDNTPILSEACS